MDLGSIFAGLSLGDAGYGDYAGKEERQARRKKRKSKRTGRKTIRKTARSSRKDLRQSTRGSDLSLAEKIKARVTGRESIRSHKKVLRKAVRAGTLMTPAGQLQAAGKLLAQRQAKKLLEEQKLRAQRQAKAGYTRAADGTIILSPSSAAEVLRVYRKKGSFTGPIKLSKGQLRGNTVFFSKGRSVSRTHFKKIDLKKVGRAGKKLPRTSEEAMALAVEASYQAEQYATPEEAYEVEQMSAGGPEFQPSSADYWDGGSSGGGGGGGGSMEPYSAEAATGYEDEADYEDDEDEEAEGSNTMLYAGVGAVLLGVIGFYLYKQRQEEDLSADLSA